MDSAQKYVFKNMMPESEYEMFCKTLLVIDSCKTINQVMVACEYNRLARIKVDYPWSIHGYIIAKIKQIQAKASSQLNSSNQ